VSDQPAFFAPKGSALDNPSRRHDGLEVPAWVLDLEQAHHVLRRVCRVLENGVQPVIDLAPSARALEQVLGAIFDAMDHRDDPGAAVRRALAALGAVFAHLSPGAALDPAIQLIGGELREAWKHLGDAATRLAPLVPRSRTEWPDLIASRDVPRLHAIDRPSLVPVLHVPLMTPIEVLPQPPAPIPRPTTFEELDTAMAELTRRAEAMPIPLSDDLGWANESASLSPNAEPPPPGFALVSEPATDEISFIRARARDCFDEVAMVGTQRAPLLGDPWRTALVLERRMLSAIDAIVALGSAAIAYLEPLVRDAPVSDPAHAFAIGMTLGCLAGRDSLAAVERILFAAAPAEPDWIASFAAALKVAPHDSLSLSLRTLLRDPFAGHRALAIDVLGYRGLVTSAELAAASADAPEVFAAALPYLALSADPLLRTVIDTALAEEENPALRDALWLSMALSGHPRTRSVLEAALSGAGSESAALLLALSGDARDAATLLAAATAAPTRPLITAVGWAGAASAIVPLLKFLEHDDDMVRAAAAYALDRITGAGMWEDTEVPVEDIVVADPPEPDVGEPRPVRLARMVSNPRDLPLTPAPEVIRRPTTSVDRWRAYWAERGPSYELTARYRRGIPYLPSVSLRELDTFPCTPGERRSLQRELVIRTGTFVRLDPLDFVAVQEEALRAWEPIAARASSSPGAWYRPARL
jgi:hypothetical protein